MTETVRVKLVVCLFLVLSYLFLPRYGFTSFSPLPLDGHLLYPFSHANVWHLLANLVCFMMLPCALYLYVTIPIAIACSFLPCVTLYDLLFGGYSTDPTMGFSGVLFAIVGISWGRIHRFDRMISKNKWFLIIPAFLPHINFLIHIYCMLFGYLYGALTDKNNKSDSTICDRK